MANQIKSAAEYQAALAQDKAVLIDFYADWCGPCQMQLPVVDRIADKFSNDVEVLKINVDEHPAIAQQYGVRSIPALFLVQDRNIKDQMVGYQSEAVLEDKIRQLATA